MLIERARAKINLTLRVLGRRADGYHELESLVAFAGVADTLTLSPGADLSLAVAGPTAAAAGPVEKNLVMKAARLLAARVHGLRMGAFALTKRLPAPAGLGGGSADAAAALRLLARLNDLPLDDDRLRATARETGADVSVCLESRARVMRGVGDLLGPPVRLPPLFAVLVNPGVGVETRAVFTRLGLAEGIMIAAANQEEPPRTSIEALRGVDNDLQASAIIIAPVIGEVLARIEATPDCQMARMSGSGATCFGLYQSCAAAARASKALRAARPDWWIRPTILR